MRQQRGDSLVSNCQQPWYPPCPRGQLCGSAPQPPDQWGLFAHPVNQLQQSGGLGGWVGVGRGKGEGVIRGGGTLFPQEVGCGGGDHELVLPMPSLATVACSMLLGSSFCTPLLVGLKALTNNVSKQFKSA